MLNPLNDRFSKRIVGVEVVSWPGQPQSRQAVCVEKGQAYAVSSEAQSIWQEGHDQ
ncbi:hypothetical protein KIN20_035743 [Parelaphostrongylus tenuis]|uniref:Uncharacterized protein n=1 Tax=Parelaphostrongylus tenuis TaxID=148309 RepID=A0AAD5RC56_PARTN|nr:hypothetical protein KIN20_035743 [Parelaphostrongylus tenuis]